MLAYLDALLAALAVRDTAEVERLLAHPLARALPDAARDEARALGGGGDALAAPLRVMQLRHQTAQLLLDSPEVAPVADRAEPREPQAATGAPDARHPAGRARRAPRLVQMELPLSA